MGIDVSCTIYQVKQKYIKKLQQEEDQKSNDGNDGMDDIVFLFMGQVLNDKAM